MKRNICVIILFLFALAASAQSNYHKISIGINGGLNQGYTDLSKNLNRLSAAASIDYHITPFLSTGLEYQVGSITGGDSITDPNKRFFVNKYRAIMATGKIQLEQIRNLDKNSFLYALRGLYTGTGIGFIKNTMSPVVRRNPGTLAVYPGASQSTNFLIPLNVGLNVNLSKQWGYPRFILNLNYQFNITLGEGLDGYNEPDDKTNSYPDMYRFASIGLKFRFGPQGVY